MDIIVTRSRLPGIVPHAEYRALVPVGELDGEHRRAVHQVRAPAIAHRQPCVRLAHVIAPIEWFSQDIVGRVDLAARLGLAAQRIEALIVRSVYPEMTAFVLPIRFRLDGEASDAATRVGACNLTGAFARLEPQIMTLAAHDLGLALDLEQLAA